MPYVSVSGAARQISDEVGCPISPPQISNLFYRRHLDDKRCPIVGRSRLIPVDYIPAIVAELRRRGLMQDRVGS